MENLKNIIETAVEAGNFKTLYAAVNAAGLAETLSSPGPFTVFAPADDAFLKLPEGTVDNLLKDPEGKLKDILLYHVVEGKVMSTDVVKLEEAETVGGKKLNIDTSEGVKVNDAKVLTADVECSNGVIHIIDSVLIPE